MIRANQMPKIQQNIANSPARSATGAPPEAERSEVESVQIRSMPPLESPKKAIDTLVAGFGYVEFPQVSPDGKRLVFNVVHNYATSQMFIVDSDGGKVRSLFTGEKVKAENVAEFLARHEGKIDEQATWSRDGKSLFYRTNSLGTFALGTFDFKSNESRVVAHDEKLNMKHPFETESGKVVCYGGPPDDVHQTVDKYSNLFLVDPKTGSSKMLTHSQGEVAYKHPAEMHGKIVAHKEFKGQGAGPAELVTIDPKTGVERNLTQTPDMDERHPFYNQRRDLLVYHRRDAGGDKNLVLSTPDGSRSAQITFYGAPAQSPCWSPDGKKIYFVKKLHKPENLEFFYDRQAEVRVMDVPQALEDLKDQAKARLKELKKLSAGEETIAQAEAQLDDYRYFLKQYR